MNIFKRIKNKKHTSQSEIFPEEILLDSRNIPEFDSSQFEGRLEKPISRWMIYTVGGVFVILIGVFLFQAWNSQIIHGQEYLKRSEKNILRPVPIFASRGIIYDRNGLELAWNTPITDTEASEDVVAKRQYATTTGLAHILGYVQYPTKDINGFYYREDYEGVDGTEKYFDQQLRGGNGSRLVEVDAQNNIISENVVRTPKQGQNVTLSIDSRVQSQLYKNIKEVAETVGFAGGAGVIMDIKTGEIIALTSYPEYKPQIISDKTDTEAIRKMLNDTNLPFLDRAVDGLYTPGSIVKPFIALGALEENIIEADTVILTTGSISIPNPYDSTKSTLFRDWKNHGAVDMRHAIAVSSDAYFYIIGGGYKDFKGLGIVKIDDYLRRFGFGEAVPNPYFSNKTGTIPTPEWKKTTFNENWYVGDTYHTAIGQYGFQVTPVQMVRAVAAIANNGTLINPTILKGEIMPNQENVLGISSNNYKIVKEGMRLSVTEGTIRGINLPFTHIAAKSGTAELGTTKEKINSWITGFFPYENPRYAFAVMLERGTVHYLIGAAAVMRQELNWMYENTPEYFEK